MLMLNVNVNMIMLTYDHTQKTHSIILHCGQTSRQLQRDVILVHMHDPCNDHLPQKEEERHAHPREDEVAPFSAETRSHRHEAIVPEAYTLQSPARGDTHLKVSLPQ